MNVPRGLFSLVPTCATAILLAVPIATSAPKDPVVFVDCDGTAAAAARPKAIILACADGNARLVNLRWTKWGGGVATARGSAALNDCTPTCVGGHFRRYPVRVALSAVRPCKGLRQYTRLTITYTGKPFPNGRGVINDRRGCAHPA